MGQKDFFNRGTLGIEDSSNSEFERLRDELELSFQRASTPVRKRLDIAAASSVDAASARMILDPALSGHMLVLANNAAGTNTLVEVYLRDANGFRGGGSPVASTALSAAPGGTKVTPVGSRVLRWDAGDRWVVITTDGSVLMFKWDPVGGFTVEEPAAWVSLLGAGRVGAVVNNSLIAYDGTDIVGLLLTDQAAATLDFTIAAADLGGKTPAEVFGDTASGKMFVINTDDSFFHETVPAGGGVAAIVPSVRAFAVADTNAGSTGYAKSESTNEVFAVIETAAGVGYLRRISLRAASSTHFDIGDQGLGVVGVGEIDAVGNRVWVLNTASTRMLKLSREGNILSWLDVADYASLGALIPPVMYTAGELDDGAKRLYVGTDVLVELRF